MVPSNLKPQFLRKPILLVTFLLILGQAQSWRNNNNYWVRGKDGNDHIDGSGFHWNSKDGDGKIAYAGAQKSPNGRTGMVEIGFLQQRSGIHGFQVSNNVLTGSIEGYYGGLIRATAYDMNLHAGPVDVGFGFSVDTGLLFHNGVELKFLGQGFKLERHEMQLCLIIFCVDVHY